MTNKKTEDTGAEQASDRKRGKDFGEEGTNKTVPLPKPDAEPTEELLNTKTKYIEKSPYTRG